MLDNLHKSITNVTKSSTIVACLELCGYETSEDYRSINSQTLNDIERYISNISLTMTKENRSKYMEEAFIDSPNLFTISPVVKARLLSFLQQIFALGDFYSLVNGVSQSQGEIYNDNLTKNTQKYDRTTLTDIDFNLNSVPRDIIYNSLELSKNNSSMSLIIDKNNKITEENNSINEYQNEQNFETNEISKTITKSENVLNMNSINEDNIINTLVNGVSQYQGEIYNNSLTKNTQKCETTTLTDIDNDINLNSVPRDISVKENIYNSLELSKNDSPKSSIIDKNNKINEENTSINEYQNEQNFETNEITKSEKFVHIHTIDENNIIYNNRKSQRIKRFALYSKNVIRNENLNHDVVNVIDDSNIDTNVSPIKKDKLTKLKKSNKKMSDSIISKVSLRKIRRTDTFHDVSNVDFIPNSSLQSINCISRNSNEGNIEIESDSLNYQNNSDSKCLIPVRNITLANEATHECIIKKVIKYLKSLKLETGKDFNFYHYDDNKRWGFYLCKLCPPPGNEIKAKVTMSNNVVFFSILAHLKNHFEVENDYPHVKTIISLSPTQPAEESTFILDSEIKRECELFDDTLDKTDENVHNELSSINIAEDRCSTTLGNYIVHRSIVRQAKRKFKNFDLKINDDFNFYYCNDNKKCGIFICKLCLDNIKKIKVKVTSTNRLIYPTIMSHLKIHFSPLFVKKNNLKDRVTQIPKMLKISSKDKNLSKEKDIIKEHRIMHILECGSKFYTSKCKNNKCSIQESKHGNIERTLSLADLSTHRDIVRNMSKKFTSKKLRITKDFNFYFFEDNKKLGFFLCKLCLKKKKIDCKIYAGNKIVLSAVKYHLRKHFGYKRASLKENVERFEFRAITTEVNENIHEDENMEGE